MTGGSWVSVEIPEGRKHVSVSCLCGGALPLGCDRNKLLSKEPSRFLHSEALTENPASSCS